MKRFLPALLTIPLLLLSGCIAGRGAEDYSMEKVSYTSDVSTQDCFLCGDGGTHVTRWGENNIGIISLNTFEVMPIEINRYGNDGELIEENTGCITMRMFRSEAGGFSASVMEDVDRGHAFVIRPSHPIEIKRLCIKAMEAIIAVASMAFSWNIGLLFVL